MVSLAELTYFFDAVLQRNEGRPTPVANYELTGAGIGAHRGRDVFVP